MIIGIDPGKRGAISFLRGREANVFPTPLRKDGKYDMPAMLQLIRIHVKPLVGNETIYAIIEELNPMPGEIRQTTHMVGEGLGAWKGLLISQGAVILTVRPQIWKRAMGVTSDKSTSIACAKRRFPEVNLKRTPNCHKDSHDLAEALLIADYLRQILDTVCDVDPWELQALVNPVKHRRRRRRRKRWEE